jgi:1-acyl-sn-glycerol-3-phosphate acyltransferase
MMGRIRSIWRFLYFAFSTIGGIIRFNLSVFWGVPKEIAGPRLRKRWLSHVPHQMGVRMQVEGTPHPGPCLYVGNHVTYIDPIVTLMHVDANVVAKAEVLDWPLVGSGAQIVGTIFVKRDEKDSREATAIAIREALKSGTSILVFPEGTTSAGPLPMTFRPRSFAAAHLAGVPVQPIAIYYESPLIPYIGDDTFLPHFFRIFRLKYIRGRIAFGPPLYGEDTCVTARQWIVDAQSRYVQTPIANDPA